MIGEHTRQNDITVNVTKSKQLTNMRASGSDDKAVIVPPKIFTLEEALEYIQDDEYGGYAARHAPAEDPAQRERPQTRGQIAAFPTCRTG